MREFEDFVEYMENNGDLAFFLCKQNVYGLADNATIALGDATTALSKEEFHNRFVEILRMGVDESLFDDQKTIDEHWISVGEFNDRAIQWYQGVKSQRQDDLIEYIRHHILKNFRFSFLETTLVAMGVIDKYREKLMSEEMLQCLFNDKKASIYRDDYHIKCLCFALIECFTSAEKQYKEEVRLEAEEANRKELEEKHRQAEQIKAFINDIDIPMVFDWDEIMSSIYQANDLNENTKEMIKTTQGEIPDDITAELLAYALSNEDKEFIQYMQERTDFIYNVPLCDYMTEKYGAETLKQLEDILVEIEAEEQQSEELADDKPKIRKR